MNPLFRTIAALLVLGATQAPDHASAQIEWLNPEGQPGIQFEFTAGAFDKPKPYYQTDLFSFPTAGIFVTARGQLLNSFSGVIEFSYFSTKYAFSDGSFGLPSRKTSQAGIANPYLGFEIGRTGTSLIGNFGVRIPFISRQSAYWAVPTQYIASHRFMAFVNDVTQISSNFGYRYMGRGGFGLRVAAGGQLGVPNGGDVEVFADLATNFWLRTNKARFMTGISSLCLVTESGVDFEDRLLTSISFSADVILGRFEPGIHFQLPVGDNLSEVLDHMYGMHLSYYFPASRSNR